MAAPITYYDARKGEGKTKNKIQINIGTEFNMVIAFKSGGVLEIPAETTALPSGGLCHTELYGASTVEGVVTVDRHMCEELQKIYPEQGGYLKRTAIYEQYSSTGDCTLRKNFGNACIKKWIGFDIPELGSEVDCTISFSLNDLNEKSIRDPILPTLVR